MKLNFLVLGSGAREHAIALKLSQSSLLNKLYLADANDGFCDLGEVVEYWDFEDLAQKSKSLNIDIAVVGPENPICEGIADALKKHGINCIGTNQKWSALESSKHFAKKFMQKHSIKTAKYQYIEDFSDVIVKAPPYVLKADGLCKGKGVSIVDDLGEAEKTVHAYLSGKFGDGSKSLLIEEFLEGEEFSLMSLWDGENLLSFLPARDFKKINNSPSAPNTGGMGAFCPTSLSNEQAVKLKEYENKLKIALLAENADFTGFVYSGLIWSKEDFYVLEYNVRLGDPETQAILTHLESDLGEVFKNAIDKKLDQTNFRWKENTSACLVLAADTYPETPSLGEKISNIPDDKVYFAGVKKIGKDFYTNGGRILSVCVNSEKPFEDAKEIAKNICFKGKYYREDLSVN